MASGPSTSHFQTTSVVTRHTIQVPVMHQQAPPLLDTPLSVNTNAHTPPISVILPPAPPAPLPPVQIPLRSNLHAVFDQSNVKENARALPPETNPPGIPQFMVNQEKLQELRRMNRRNP